MTSASALEARKQIDLGWSRLKLDPKAAMKNFESAITADPRSAAVRVQRSKARLETGNAPGALGDSDDAIALDPKLGEGYAARVAAKRALGIKEEELLADLEAAANLDARYAEEYKAVVLRVRGAAPPSAAAPAAQSSGESAPAAPRPLLESSPKGWALLALVAVLSAAIGGVIVPLLLRGRRSDEDGSPPR
jgi:tetratricopeptide (TPR) repeat protein